MNSRRSAVGAVAWMSPAKPALTSLGTRPVWSVCACVSSRQSTLAASNGKGSSFSARVARLPWNNPQSTSTRRVPVSSSVQEPVTVPAAPKNESVLMA